MTSSTTTQPEIRIRPYRNSDFEETRKIFLDFMVGDESPFTLAMRKQITTPLSLTSYSMTAFGLVLIFLANSATTRNIGIALSLIGLSTFFCSRYSLRSAFNQYVTRSLTGDLADIGKHYGLVDTSNGNRYKGKSCFWIAEATRDGLQPEIVGCVGLDVNTNTDETSAELRRLVVSPKYRRRGIAQQLIQAVVQHAREHNIKSIFLTTSSYQLAAINMYKKLGFVVEEIKEISLQMQKFQIYAFNLNVSNYKV